MKSDFLSPEDRQSQLHWQIMLILLGLIVWGGWLRIYALDFQSFWIDESYSALAAEKTAESGVPEFDSGRYYSRSKPHIYLRALCYRISGKSVFALRLPSAVLGTAMIALSFWGVLILFRRWPMALIAAVLVCCNYYEIAWSRQVRMYMELQFFFALAFLLGYLSLSRRKFDFIFVIAMLSIVLTTLVHKTGILIAVPLFFLALTDEEKQVGRKWFITVLLFASCLPAFVFLTAFSGGAGRGDGQFFLNLNSLGQAKVHLWHYLNFLMRNYTVIVIPALIAMVNGIFRRDRILLVLSLSVWTFLILISFYQTVSMRAIFVFVPFLVFLAANGYGVAARFLAGICLNNRSAKRELPFAGLVLAFAVLSASTISSQQTVFVPQKEYYLEFDPAYSVLNRWDYTPQPDFKEAYNFVRANLQEGDVVLAAHTAMHHWYLPDTQAYWLGFLFIYDARRSSFFFMDEEGKQVEGYMGYPVIENKNDLEDVLNQQHGFVLVDHFSVSAKREAGILEYLEKRAPVVFEDQAHPERKWTKIWVGRF